MKVCSQCKKELPLDSFDKQKTGKQGVRADCKACKKRFVQSKEGLVNKIYSQQKSKSKLRKHPLPAYTKEDLYLWLFSNPEYDKLYTKWVSSGYSTKLIPSVDRLDDYKPYTLENIQLMTWEENSNKYNQDQKKGLNNKRNLAVDQLDLEGNFIKRFHSASYAAREVGSTSRNITLVCKGEPIKRKNPDGSFRMEFRKTIKGYKWRWSTTPN